ncbi:regulator of microtubule dynamics protein 1-like [Bolinopsis microptera]|uniref:regulator of microtubule dynamics protein 1-like n=1 Tax=Bolinopsis microptera TaxID=2820187 RepID=UPI003078CA08
MTHGYRGNLLTMITRYARCGKRACTLVSSYSVKDRAQTNTPVITRTYYTPFCEGESHSGREHEQSSKIYWTGFLVAGILAASTEPEEPTKSDDLPPELLEYLDNLYNTRQYVVLNNFMQRYTNLNSADVLWRRARVQWELLKQEGQDYNVLNRKGRVSQMQELENLIDQALALDEKNSSAHLWKAILSNACSTLAGFKKQFQNLKTMEYHLRRAINLDPNQAAANTLLGSLYMNLLDMPLLIRVFVNLFWEMPEEYYYEDALMLFLKAEEVAPKTSIENLFMTGKAYFRLDRTPCAKHYLELAMAQPVVTNEDQAFLEEAKQFYKTNFKS